MINKKIIMIFGLVVVGLIFILGGFLIKQFFFYQYIKETALTNDFVITPDWQEIGNPDLLKTDKEIQYISIILEPPFEEDAPGGGIKTPEGSIINPEIRLTDLDGKEYQLTFTGSRHFQNNRYVNYMCKNSLPIDKRYSKVMIRSAVKIPVKQILWSGYNAKDLP